jgi:hypothetical protein
MRCRYEPRVAVAASAPIVGVGCGSGGNASSGQPSCTDGQCAMDASSEDGGVEGGSDSPVEAPALHDGAPDGSPVGDSGATADGSSVASGPGFPRLGSLDISTVSGASNGGYDTGYTQWAAKIHVNVVGANWTGAGAALSGGSREAFVKAIHTQSTVGSRVFQYFNTDNDGTYWPMANVADWLLYQHGASGTCAPNTYEPSVCNTNQTVYTQADSDGLHLEGEYARALIATLVSGSTSDAAPSMDGTFHDNTILTPTATGDYERNGTQEAVGDPTAGGWVRAGLAEGYAYLQARSSLIAIGNLGGWGITGGPGGGTNASSLSEVVQGGLIEGELGDSWSVETWSGFALAKSHYQFCMANTVAPRLVLVHHSKLQVNGSDPTGFAADGSPTGYGPPYQAMRYGLALTLMDDGYYATTQTSDYFASERNWFDEYAVDPLTGVALAFPNVDAGLGYLGQPSDPAWPAPLPTGVYERHFTNAATGKTWLVLLNPKGNGVQTVQLGVAAKKLTGTQDPTVNDGSTVTSVTLHDRDGIIVQLK